MNVKRTIKVLQHRMLRIFIREIGMLCRDFSIDVESVVEDADACFWIIACMEHLG